VANCSRVDRGVDWFQVQTLDFVFVEIGTSSRVLATPSMVQHVTKPIRPLRGGIG